MEIESLHHVAITVTDLDRSRRFYREIIQLEEIARPNFSFPGAWLRAAGGQQVHLIVHTNSTFRGPEKGLDPRDIHFALRVKSYREALEFLRGRGYREDAGSLDLMKMIAQPDAVAGFPQIYIMDPDRHVIEINAAQLD